MARMQQAGARNGLPFPLLIFVPIGWPDAVQISVIALTLLFHLSAHAESVSPCFSVTRQIEKVARAVSTSAVDQV